MRSLNITIPRQVNQISWHLLLFLVLFLQVKMGIKVIAIVMLTVLLRKQFDLLHFFRQRYTWFYVGMIVLAMVNTVINSPDYSTNYWVALATGIGCWLMCIASAAIIFTLVKKTEPGKVHTTITLFFLLNAVMTLVQLISFMWDSGSFNPYTYQGMHQKYFIGTGDLLKGITLDVSTTNALLNSMAVIYFLSRRKFHWVLLSVGILLLTASNFTNLLLFSILILQFIFQSDRDQKSVIIVCLCMLIIFFARVSPQNKHYLNYVWQKVSHQRIDTIMPERTPALLKDIPDTMLDNEQRRKKTAMRYLDSVRVSRFEKTVASLAPVANIDASSVTLTKPSIPEPNIHSEPFQSRKDTSAFRKKLIDFAVTTIPGFDTSLRHLQQQPAPGKLMALRQTVAYLKEHPIKLLLGAGTGNFSSKLAFRATSLQFAGGYPAKYAYIHPDFRTNHLDLYLNYFSKDRQFHSLMNSPDSVYDQLLAEYGIVGLISFTLFYFMYFVRRVKKRSYGLPVLSLAAGALATGYWFEQFSVMVVFELLLLLDHKEIPLPRKHE